MEKGVPIRSVSRSLKVLQVINRLGSMSMMDIARASRIPYPTACRIVQTLMHEGIMEREHSRKHYRLTSMVKTLANGFQDTDRLVEIARPHVQGFTRATYWPILVTTRVGSEMMVRDTTQAMTSLTFTTYPPGHTLPLLESASGRAYMAFAGRAEREVILEGLAESGQDYDPHSFALFRSGAMVEDIRKLGLASSSNNTFGSHPGKTSSLAVPLFREDAVCGTVTMIYFSNAMKPAVAVERFGAMLKDTADEIGRELLCPEPEYA